MANVDLMSVGLRDWKGKSRTLVVFLPTGYTIAELQAFSNALLPLVDSVSGGLITGSTVVKNLTLPAGLKGVADAYVDIERGANIGFDAANTQYRHTLRVPGIVQAAVAGDTVYFADPDIDAFQSFIIAGDLTVSPSDDDGNDLTGLLSGTITFHK